MSDNSHSTGSSGSSTNSWTLLSPEEAAVESLGPVDDGTESLGDVPSLSEEVAGATAEIKPSEIAIETILSEEGHQVCQETSPEAGEGPIPSSPICSSPALTTPAVIADDDMESQPPVIHDIVTSSPGDYEHLGATPFATNLNLGEQLDIPIGELSPPEFYVSPSPPFREIPETPVAVEPVLDVPADAEPVSGSPLLVEPISAPEATVGIAPESEPLESPSLESSEPSSEVEVKEATEVKVPEVLVPEISVQGSPTPESSEPENSDPDMSTSVGPRPETVGPTEEQAVQMSETELHEKVTQIEEEEAAEDPSNSFSFTKGDTSSDDDGLRRRHVQSFDAPRPRTSDEEDEEEEDVEFKMAEKKEEKQGLSLTKCIVGALVLLCLGSLFLSDDSSEFGEQNQNWPNTHDMKELLDKLEQENQKISQLEAQLQAQQVELDSALQAAAVKGDVKVIEDLEKENIKMKDELSSLPDLKEELETLRARVNEFTQLTDNQGVQITTPKSSPQPAETDQKTAAPQREMGPKDGGMLKEELHRQKVLLEESSKRLEKMKRHGGKRKGVRDGLEEIQKSLSEQVERFSKKKPWESKSNGNSGKDSPDQWRKQDKQEKRSERDRQNNKDGGQQDKVDRREKAWKSHKQNSPKEAWRKHQDEWDRKKGERHADREQRKQQKPWHSLPSKDPHSHSHHQHHTLQHQEPHQYNHQDFWKHQEEKLRRNVQPLPGCTTAEDCASKEGLYPVELSEFEELLEGYLSKLEGSPPGSREAIRKLTAKFFEDGVFIHDRVRFSDFAEDVADILEDMADILEEMGQGDDDTLEEEMEEFEREALWKFSATA